ncbi:LysR family transcriptional regulator [Flexivirga oryzae]|uniref:DNA-binding transcriptional LysR family regulator n=1 Tax=Flexivirga oryzae TaxID=1794944 RepID=A0A839N2D6_9MICO|nr:LysR family transcriptional regulator [Flexivirga oryzae]MBB2891878.1 DNA-binding transcriptional LysR family regulator [Flexivirga oryzae]
MGLGGTDLNLLVAMQALLEEGNVTNAGKRLELSQPAMSGALAKLRRRFDDELLTRSGRDYELTPLARELLPQVQRAVHLLGRAMQVEEEFDPATSTRLFRLTMSDYAIAVLHEPLMAVISAQAPHLRLQIDKMGPDLRASERVLVDYDVMVGPQGFGFLGENRPLWRDRMVCLVDRGNPRLRNGRLELADLRALSYAVGEFGPGNLTPADRAAAELGLDRRVSVQVSGWLPLPFVIQGTDMVAVLPDRLARMVIGPGTTLTVADSPFDDVPLVEGYWFAPSRLDDPAHCWLFDRLDETREALAAG